MNKWECFSRKPILFIHIDHVVKGPWTCTQQCYPHMASGNAWMLPTPSAFTSSLEKTDFPLTFSWMQGKYLPNRMHELGLKLQSAFREF
jgi:hypothetical protein